MVEHKDTSGLRQSLELKKLQQEVDKLRDESRLRNNRWSNDNYIRDLLDRREKWATVLSLSATAAAFVFLSNHSPKDWLKFIPSAIGVFGSLYVFTVNCYYEQAEEIAKQPTKAKKTNIKKRCLMSFGSSIGFLGLLNVAAPAIAGIIGTFALFKGFEPTIAMCPHTRRFSSITLLVGQGFPVLRHRIIRI